jgi:GrpB-like predicted nucleotidyltransferase (UPF0157 family)
MSASVVIVNYDQAWPRLFAAEEKTLRRALGDAVQIEHVGSTAVPGLVAKPIIDIMVGVHRLGDAAAYIAPLEQLGYEYVPEFEEFIPERRYFRKGPPTGRTHHLHMVEQGTAFWKQHILFRDWLRTHPRDAGVYAELKRELAARYRTDRDAYTDAKTEFIRRIEQQARKSR